MTTKIKLKVDPVDVLTAYEKTGIEPDNGWNSCALGVLAKVDHNHGSIEGWADSKFGARFVGGFIVGFDGAPSGCWGYPEYTEGHANGVLVRAAVFGGE